MRIIQPLDSVGLGIKRFQANRSTHPNEFLSSFVWIHDRKYSITLSEFKIPIHENNNSFESEIINKKVAVDIFPA